VVITMQFALGLMDTSPAAERVHRNHDAVGVGVGVDEHVACGRATPCSFHVKGTRAHSPQLCYCTAVLCSVMLCSAVLCSALVSCAAVRCTSVISPTSPMSSAAARTAAQRVQRAQRTCHEPHIPKLLRELPELLVAEGLHQVCTRVLRRREVHQRVGWLRADKLVARVVLWGAARPIMRQYPAVQQGGARCFRALQIRGRRCRRPVYQRRAPVRCAGRLGQRRGAASMAGRPVASAPSSGAPSRQQPSTG
jgi:hypothetical protein